MVKYVTSRKLDMLMYSILSHYQWFRSKITVAGSISLNRANPVFSGVIDQTCIASLLSLLRSQGHCLCGKLVQKLLVNFTMNYKEMARNKCNNVYYCFPLKHIIQLSLLYSQLFLLCRLTTLSG